MSKNIDYTTIFDLTNIKQGNIKYNYLSESISFDEFFTKYFNLDERIIPNKYIKVKDKLITRNSQLKELINYVVDKKIKKSYTKLNISNKRKEESIYVKKIGLFREEYVVNYFVAPNIDNFVKEFNTLSEVLKFSGDISKTNFWWLDFSTNKISHLKNSSFYRSVGISSNDDEVIFTEYIQMMDNAGNINPDYKKMVEEEHRAYDDCVSGVRNSYKCKYPLLTKNGDTMWVDTYVKVVKKDRNNRPLLMIGVDLLVSDEVTAQLEAETLKKVIDEGLKNSDIGVWWMTLNNESKTFEFNDKLRDLYGYKEKSLHLSDVHGKKDTHWLNAKQKVLNKYPEYKSFFDKDNVNFKKLVSGTINQYRSILPLYNNHGVINWLEVRSSAVSKNVDGTPNIISGTAIDITELFESGRVKEVSDKFIKIQNANKAAVEMADLLIWTIDFDEHPDGHYFYGSDSYCEKLGLTKDNSGYVSIEEYLSTILESENSEVMGIDDINKLTKSCHEEYLDGFDGVILKHKNLKSNEIQYMKHFARVHSRKLDGTIRHMGGYLVDVTNEYKQKERVEKLTVSNSKIQEFNQLAIAAGNLLVFNIKYDKNLDNSTVYVNDLFVKKLGVIPNKDSSITYSVYESTVADDAEGKKLFDKVTKEYIKILKGESNSINKIITKNKNPNTNEIIYLEHHARVEQRDSNGRVLALGGFLRDVTNEILYEKKIKYLAENDVLTDLYNRNSFEQHCKVLGDKPYSIIISDIDGLKLTNDIFGHLVGDEILTMFAKFLKDLYKDSKIYRIGGDEFAIISDIIDENVIEDKNYLLKQYIHDYNKKTHYNIGVSIGYEIVVDKKMDFQTAFITAENEMYHRKLSNRSSRKSRTLDTLLTALNEKTEETREHCDRLSMLAQDVLKKMGYTRNSDIHNIGLAATVHDIGKITIAEEILTKPGKLTDEEYEKIKKHSEAGYKIIINIVNSNKIAEAILYHHERHDGLGYPYGLKDKEIPLFAKIISVCDAYDTMVYGRTYKKPMSIKSAIEEIERCKETQFDPKVADVLIQVIKEKHIKFKGKTVINA